MLYSLYELNRRAAAPVVATYGLTARALGSLPSSVGRRRSVRRARALCEVLAKARPTHERPEFGIDHVLVNGQVTSVLEEEALVNPFSTLLHFRRSTLSGGSAEQPRVLVVGPLSGHFTTLIRPTIRTLLSDHDVYVLDWHNARDIPVEEGRFGLDDYVEHVMTALRHLGSGTHVVAVCQPAVPVLAAVALLAAAGDAAQPTSVTLIAGPVDARINPGPVNAAADDKPLAYFEKRVITTVPRGYAGAGRRVYPGFVQLAAFMSLDRSRHRQAHAGLYRDLVAGRTDQAAATRSFYDEYGAVMDVPAEFYLETVDRIFQRHLMARGELTWRDQPVDVTAITRTALLTVEGERDEICPPGQTLAAHDLCSGIPDVRKQHYVQPGVGHYGVFSGSKWEAHIYPVVRDFIRASVPSSAAV